MNIISILFSIFVGDTSGATQTFNLSQFLTTDMNKKVIVSIQLPSLDNTYHVKTFKVTKMIVIEKLCTCQIKNIYHVQRNNKSIYLKINKNFKCR
jgi:hypothetical protein